MTTLTICQLDRNIHKSEIIVALNLNLFRILKCRLSLTFQIKCPIAALSIISELSFQDLLLTVTAVSYTHLTLPTNREV